MAYLGQFSIQHWNIWNCSMADTTSNELLRFHAKRQDVVPGRTIWWASCWLLSFFYSPLGNQSPSGIKCYIKLEIWSGCISGRYKIEEQKDWEKNRIETLNGNRKALEKESRLHGFTRLSRNPLPKSSRNERAPTSIGPRVSKPKGWKCMKMVTWKTSRFSLRRPTWLLHPPPVEAAWR